ncbi:dymeclin, variant [Capsaspora owczarzaki ATCC 30864]|uniref:Dymeclin n=1 Tax=Capsaspora owczarzaki (strain ATCC 30864) TaxID=595528 RepID=A0A0D2VPF1_CAPO3|nr:dymeclin, variant [Capsaspora owczarzaki ATCC 30864]
MGAGLSTEAAADATMPPMAQVTLQTVATLPRLVAICSATQTLAPSDALWADLLAFEIDLPGDDESPRALSMTENGELELALAPLASELVSHNLETRNLGNLILLLLTHVRILGDIPVAATPGIRAGLYQRTLNAVLLLRVFVKHLFETLPPRIALRHFSAHTASVAASLQTSQRAGMSASADEIDLKEQLVLSLVQLLVDTPSTPDYLSTEAINLMTVLLSLQLYLPTIEANDFLMHVMTGACRQRAHQLLGRLLTRFADHAAPSKPSQLKAPGAASYSLIPWRSQPNATLTPEERAVHVEALNREDVASDPGAEASLLLLLLLCNHGVRKPGGNPFQAALSTFRDSAQDFSVSESGRPPLGVVQLSYTKLYSVLCQRLHNQQTTLLLYLLLHANTSFTTFLLSRTDLQNVLIPMLQTLYNAASQPSQQIYMLLIIVLILSQDHSFNKGIHEQSLPSVPWYTEKTIHQISLGSLIVIVLARTIQYNLAKLKDLYMNTNCLAALANMSPHFHALHQYAAERIVGLFLLLSKRFETLKKAASSSSESEVSGFVF